MMYQKVERKVKSGPAGTVEKSRRADAGSHWLPVLGEAPNSKQSRPSGSADWMLRKLSDN